MSGFVDNPRGEDTGQAVVQSPSTVQHGCQVDISWQVLQHT